MFSPLLFLGGFNIFNGEKLAKLIFYAVLIAIGIGIYHKTFIAPTFKTIQTTRIQQARDVTVYNDGAQAREKFFGVKLWKLKAGLTWGQ
jgi:hypothetical protein